MAACSVVPFAAVAGRCDLCGKRLTGRQRTWCSKKCALAYRKQHAWTQARAAARRRDKYRCCHCGLTKAQGAKLEVNHIVPLNGRGYQWGCVHHLSNLECLCHACHLLVTRAQRAARKKAA